MKKGKPHTSHSYCSTPPVCTAVGFPFVRQYTEKALGVGASGMLLKVYYLCFRARHLSALRRAASPRGVGVEGLCEGMEALLFVCYNGMQQHLPEGHFCTLWPPTTFLRSRANGSLISSSFTVFSQQEGLLCPFAHSLGNRGQVLDSFTPFTRIHSSNHANSGH